MKRAEMPPGMNQILNQRSLSSANRRLAELIQPGMRVLDVGCGSGAITKGIAEQAGPDGQVVGIDSSKQLIEEARERYGEIPNLHFEIGDIYNLKYEGVFDIVSASRILQWLSRPQDALHQMKKAARPGGRVLVLDYNHERIVWRPAPPASMQHFYRRFLE
ncbi:methyltransferase domain-containing protein [Paenibacillus sp. JX-17]|uniref:Methyltransferase domain-containing protein n=1 Tax=Paenibacillus lacisoli TaxID=3064525 RepID=A0ABT9C7F1_9BACL|nr:methyltransferase domain-containing protein [Paenibacillus sp. JX-17]MDO7905189.1 methyltransferase domain-containing protein [Paenibacillus sp. JX-17]